MLLVVHAVLDVYHLIKKKLKMDVFVRGGEYVEC